MSDKNAPSFSELQALLNFHPEDPCTTVGEVEDHLANTHMTAHSLIEKTEQMPAALHALAETLIEHHGPQSKHVLNLLILKEYVELLTQMVLDSLSHDATVMIAFLDLASGEDRSEE